MSLWGRFLGHRRNRACAEGVALLDKGQYFEAVDLLREASGGSADHPSGSLISFYFRQALVGLGRTHLRAQEYDHAIACFGEAVQLWELYPDLHCLHGVALGMNGDWELSLAGAREALRRNPDFAEARLLETVALQKLNRPVEAADSLNSLVESGRRIDHWLITGLAGKTQYSAADLPTDLEGMLIRSVSGQSEKEEVAAAVAQCRAGNWQEGLDRFAELVEKRPRYPDYRTRHAGALFHLGRNAEALAEVEAALALNETYRTAINLKGLILADEGRLREARDFLAEGDRTAAAGKSAPAHEELFGAYLRGVLALLGGEPQRAHELLEGWGKLDKNFARAELLLAAAEDLLGKSQECGRRLNLLVEEWAAEPIYFFLLASHHLRTGDFEAAAGVLGRWPAGSSDPDRRPLYLEAILALDRGRIPDLPAADLPGPGPTEIPPGRSLPAAAWDFLTARAEFSKGNALTAWSICTDLIAAGHQTEKIIRLQLNAASQTPDSCPANWTPPRVVPDSCLPQLMFHGVGRRDLEGAVAFLEKYLAVHPEEVRALWLSPTFWLEPVRNWIA